MPDRDPFDELDELLSDGAPAAVVVRAAAPHVVPAMHAEPVNVLAMAPTAPVDDAPALSIGQHAGRVTGKALTQLEAQLDRGELDADDLMNLLPKVHKIKATEDQIELQRTGGRVDLPTIHITIGSAGQIRAECVPPPHVEVVEGVEVVEQVPQCEAPAPGNAWSVDFRPIGAGG